MGVIIKQSIRASVFSYLGIILGFINVIFLFPQFLGKDNIGIIETIKAIVLLISPFAIFGSTSSIIKFFPSFSDNNKDNGFYLSMGMMLFLWLIIFYSFLYFFRDQFIDLLGYDTTPLGKYVWLIFPSLFSWILFHYFSIVSTSSLKIAVPRMLDSIFLRGFTSILLLSYFYSLIDIDNLISLISISYFFPALLLFIYIIKKRMIIWKLNANVFKKESFKPIFKYSRFIVFGSISTIIVQKIDVLMIGYSENLGAVGVYVIAYYIGSVIEIPKRNISDIAFPLLSTAFEKNDISTVDDIYKKSSINQFIIGALIFIVVWSCLDDVFRLMPNGEEYAIGKYVVFYIGISKLFDMLMGVNHQIIQSSAHYKYNLYINIVLSVLVVGFNAIFIPIYSITGAAIASMLAVFCYNLVSYIIVYRLFKIQPISIVTLKLFIVSLVIVVIGIYLPSIHSEILSIAYKTILLSLIFGLAIYSLNISPQVNDIIKNALNKLKRD